ncbi:MAG: anti-sigma factor domain-containing protein [Pyrinomonadaceae bacterium]
MTHEEYKEMLAAAALDALDAGAGDTLAAHLAACAECRSELDELYAATAALAYANAPVVPAPDLRARLLAQIKLTPQTGGTPANAATPNGAATANTTTATTPTAPNVLPFASNTRRGIFGARPLALYGALAASVALALAITSAVLWAQNRQLHRELTRIGQYLHETQQTLVAVRAERDLLAAPDAHTAELAGTEVATKAHARLTYDVTTGRAVLTAAGLPATPPGKAYQLWFIADGKPLPGGVFTTDATGRAELREQIPPSGRHAQIFAVTLESQAGASAPTGQMYLKSTT